MQGDEIICKTDSGNISTSSCYSETSTFETNTGKLDLQNIHKTSKVLVNRDGNLKMCKKNVNLSIENDKYTFDYLVFQRAFMEI